MRFFSLIDRLTGRLRAVYYRFGVRSISFHFGCTVRPCAAYIRHEGTTLEHLWYAHTHQIRQHTAAPTCFTLMLARPKSATFITASSVSSDRRQFSGLRSLLWTRLEEHAQLGTVATITQPIRYDRLETVRIHDKGCGPTVTWKRSSGTALRVGVTARARASVRSEGDVPVDHAV